MKKRTIAVSLLLAGAAYAVISRVERRIDDRFGETGFPRTESVDSYGETSGFAETDGSGEPYIGEPYGFDGEEDFFGGADGARINADGDIVRGGVVTHRVPDFDPAYWTDERIANALPAKMPTMPPKEEPSSD